MSSSTVHGPPTPVAPESRAGRRSRRALATLTVSVLAIGVGGAVAGSGADRALEATTSVRYMDTREYDSREKLSPGGKIGVIVASVPWLPETDEPIPADAEAIFLNLTAVDAEGPGFVSVYPASAEGFEVPFEPDTSNLNIDAAGQTIANAAIVPLGLFDFFGIGDGSPVPSVIVHTSTEAHIVADVLGYVPAGSDYVSIPLTRALDTRASGGAAAMEPVDVDVAGFGPAEAAFAIVNLTLVDSTSGGFVSAWPAGASQPETSNLNVDGPGQTRAGLAIVPIGAGGAISVMSSTAGDLLVDVFGYFGPASGFTGLEPFDRVYDSRPGRVDGTTNVVVTDSDDVPDTAEYVLVNVTAVEAAAPGFITVWPGGGTQPEASNLNYAAGGTVANTVLVPLGDDGSIEVYTDAEIALLVDVIGYL